MSEKTMRYAALILVGFELLAVAIMTMGYVALSSDKIIYDYMNYVIPVAIVGILGILLLLSAFFRHVIHALAIFEIASMIYVTDKVFYRGAWLIFAFIYAFAILPYLLYYVSEYKRYVRAAKQKAP